MYQALHVRFPCICEYVLQLQDLQIVGKLGDDVIYQLVVRQGAQRIDVHVAEYLIVDVSVQLLHEFRGTQLSVHFQEHQSNFALRGEEGLTATLAVFKRNSK